MKKISSVIIISLLCFSVFSVFRSEVKAGVFADAERVELLCAESFKLTSKICIYGGLFG